MKKLFRNFIQSYLEKQNKINGLTLKLLNFIILIISIIYKFILIIYWYIHQTIRTILSFITVQSLLTVQSACEYCTKNNTLYKIIYPQKSALCYPPQFWSEKQKQVIQQENIEIIQPEVYVAELNNVYIYSNKNIIRDDKNIISDVVLNSYVQDFDLSSSCMEFLTKNNIALYSPPCTRTTMNLDKGIMLNGAASFNYYHWFTEFLPRIELINMFEKYNNYPILLDYKVAKINSIMDSLSVLNKTNREVIFLEENIEYKVNHLIKPSLLSWMAMNLKNNITVKAHHCIISEEGVNCMREAFLPTNLNNPFRKIYIARNNKSRELINETIIIETVKKYGFEVVYPEELTLSEQIKLFSECQILVGQSGAGFTNLLFMQKNTIAICLVADKIDYSGFSYFSNIASIIGINLVNLDGRKRKNGQRCLHEDLIIDQNELENVINYIHH